MRIGFDIRCLQSGTQAWGIGIYTFNLLKNLSLIDNENEYFLISHSGLDFDLELDLPETFKHSYLKVPKSAKYLNALRDKLFLASELKGHKLDIVHFPNPLSLVSDFDIGSMNKRTVITVHDLIPIHFSDSIFTGKRKILKLLYKFMLNGVRKIGHIISVSQNTKKDIESILKIRSDKISVIYEGVSEAFSYVRDRSFLKSFAEKYELPERYIFYAGNFFPYKNIENLFRAIDIIRRKYDTPVPLVISGRIHPFFRNDISGSIDRWNLSQLVRFLEFVPLSELPYLYQLAEVFVFPSLYEGFGLPPLEALASGTPVACSSASSLPEIVGDSAILFDPHDPQDIAASIIRILSSSDLKEDLRKKGRSRAKSFCWKVCAEKTLKLYYQIDAENR